MRFRLELKKHFPVIALVLLYIVVDMVLTYKEIYVFNLLPIVIFIVYLALARIDLLYFLIILLTPLSIQLIEFLPSSPVDFAIPTEPLLFGMLLLMIYRMALQGMFDRRIINHPVSYAILFNLLWIFVTAITSSMPVVSFKYLLARLWFVVSFYLVAIYVFRNTDNIRKFVFCYTIPMLVVIAYSIARHLGYGLFDKQAAHFVMNPFFRDHTSYGAILAMLFFALGAVLLGKKRAMLFQTLIWISWLIVVTALVLSYTRAAWLSVMLSLGILLLVLFKIKFRYLLLVGLLVMLYLAGERTEIIQEMRRNRQESSASLFEHIQSVSNITTDESNLERLNRWNSAFRMFKERPVFGWGPGTYMFKYAPFQLAVDKTPISTDFGNLGNAHSEYIGPLAESGLLGSISFILIGILSLVTGFRVYRKIADKQLKTIVLGMILALITYLAHGFLNNFLDTDKASALFWGFIAVFVSLDISLKELNPEN
jgi:putative inorganic carbon (hco3(-)) transporter